MINLILGPVTLSETLNALKIPCHIILLKKKYLTNLSSAFEMFNKLSCWVFYVILSFQRVSLIRDINFLTLNCSIYRSHANVDLSISAGLGYHLVLN